MLVFRALSSNCHEAGGREVALAGPNCYCGTPVLQLMSFTLVTPREQTLTQFEIISAANHLQIMADTRSKKEEIFMDVVYVVTTFNSKFYHIFMVYFNQNILKLKFIRYCTS